MRVGLAVFSHHASGMEVGTIDAALGLEAQGTETVVFAEPGARLPDRAAKLKGPVVRLQSLPGPMLRPRVADGLFLATKHALARRLAASVATNPVDVMHVFSPGCAMCLPDEIPVAVQAWFHSPSLRTRLRTYLPFAPKFPPVFLANVLREIQAHHSDALGFRRSQIVLCNTPGVADAMGAAGFPACAIPPPIEMPAPPTRPASTGPVEIAFCAHPLARPRKGLRYLLEALTLMKEGPVRLTLFGGGGEELAEEFEQVRRSGHEVRALGRVPRDKYLDLLEREIDLLAFTSLYEEWGYALFEGLSRGVPAIAFDTHPYAEIIDADTGALTRPRDSAALARALDRMVGGDRPSPQQVWESTRSRFGAAAVATRLTALYGEIANGRSPTGAPPRNGS